MPLFARFRRPWGSDERARVSSSCGTSSTPCGPSRLVLIALLHHDAGQLKRSAHATRAYERFVRKATGAAARAALAAWPSSSASTKPSNDLRPRRRGRPRPLLKRREKTQAAARLAAPHRLALPEVREGGARGHPRWHQRPLDARRRQARRDPRDSSRERDGKLVMVKECKKHGRFEDVMSVDPDVHLAHREALSRARLPRAALAPAQPRHDQREVRARQRAHRRPHQPLQHDVRPVLHGREPGRLRPRARVGRGPADPRRLDDHQAAPPDERAVLGRRADALAALPPRRQIRPRHRVFLRAVCNQRHPLRAGPRVLPRRRRRPGCASRTSSSTASPTRRTRTARWATSST